MFAGSFRATVREVPYYKLWFTYADDLNRLGLDMLQDLTVASDDVQRVTLAALFVRASPLVPSCPCPRRNGATGRLPRRAAERSRGGYRHYRPRE